MIMNELPQWFWDEVVEVAKTVSAVHTKLKFDEQEVRRFLFLDTSGHTLRNNGLSQRQCVSLTHPWSTHSSADRKIATSCLHQFDTREKSKS